MYRMRERMKKLEATLARPEPEPDPWTPAQHRVIDADPAIQTLAAVREQIWRKACAGYDASAQERVPASAGQAYQEAVLRFMPIADLNALHDVVGALTMRIDELLGVPKG